MTELESKLEAILYSVAVEVDQNTFTDDVASQYVNDLVKLFKEESERKECFPRYYLNGVYPNGGHYFLISELSVDNAKKSALTYLNMHNNKFSYIHIYTADGTYSENVAIG